ncbi:1-deoxy-D-xylulose 5-phosphate reductoisomerase [hydrothermal vent metagenome]|uniref:1-deoxy-D-xylulose-5-phosphate reductoisomerase n=1 Tax=hydrothermal vent metagenome TaxID=652676 RepID=A0A3B1AUK6_9ZZZZ
MKGLTILGATGSIGVSTLDVVARHPGSYRAVALTANHNVNDLLQQCLKFRPDYAVMADESSAQQLAEQLQEAAPEIQVLAGMDGLKRVSSLPEIDYVMAAIVGAAGLLPALTAVRAGKRLLLANKESLVMAGSLFMEEAKRHGAEILPIDSEHNAIFQCMPKGYSDDLSAIGVRRILLTASGGPFRLTPVEQLSQVTPEQACAHPNWSMGRKISVDSATMMNKGLEVIEACWLFHTKPDKIKVVLHPQSVVHSMVEYADGSVLAQMGNPDMRTPIAHAMAWPERIESGVASLDLFEVARLDFAAPDFQRFPCLSLAYQAIEQGGSAPAILNAANEVAVAAFLDGQLGFTEIPVVIESTLSAVAVDAGYDLDGILAIDAQARSVALNKVQA